MEGGRAGCCKPREAWQDFSSWPALGLNCYTISEYRKTSFDKVGTMCTKSAVTLCVFVRVCVCVSVFHTSVTAMKQTSPYSRLVSASIRHPCIRTLMRQRKDHS